MLGSKCRFCGTAIDGQSAMCMACYRARVRPCVHCMAPNRHGVWTPIYRQHVRLRDSCGHCNGEGFIFADEPCPDA